MTSCLIVDDEPLVRERMRTLLSTDGRIGTIHLCETGEEAVRMIPLIRPAVVFLDVQMPGINGFEVLQRLDHGAMPIVVFVTAFDEFALRAFDVHAVDYVLKPLSAARVALAVDRALARATEGEFERHGDERLRRYLDVVERKASYLTRFVVRRLGAAYLINVDDVDWIDSAANYIQLHVGGRVHYTRCTLSEASERLDPEHFIRVHRRIIVNVRALSRLQAGGHGEYELVMRDGARIVSSRTHSDGLRRLFR